MTTRSLLPAIHKLLDAATDADKWMPFLQELARCFNARGAQILRVPVDEKALAFSALYGYDDAIARRYASDGASLDLALARFGDDFVRLMPADPRIAWTQRYPARPLSCRLALSDEVLHNSETYKQLLDEADVEYSLVVRLPEESGSVTMLGVFRGKADSHFAEAEAESFGELIPFVRHAIQISEQLARVDTQKSWALAALDSIPIGIILATGDARVVQANATARLVLSLRDGMVLQHEIIRLENRAEEHVLHAAIRKAVARAVHAGAGAGSKDTEAFAITRPSGKEPLSALVATLWDNHVRFGLSRLTEPLATIFLGIPEQPLEAPAELLQRLFGLTAAQARLCELLVSGLTLDEAAERLEVTAATARTHLKKVFENVGVHKQSELIAKILATPIWMARTGNARPPLTLPIAS